VEGNSKGYARVKILETLVDKLSQALKFDPFSKKGGVRVGYNVSPSGSERKDKDSKKK
jgi:hypothetical protein